MNARQKLRKTLGSTGALCDDCLSSSSAIKPRQAVNQRCREMESLGQLTRQRDQCPQCKTFKIVNRLKSESVNQTPSKKRSGNQSAQNSDSLILDKPWYWEGNVQDRIVEHLKAEGWKILSSADTSSKEAGKDIIAARNNEELWVSVKGYPERSPNIQARHWFSHALFDMAIYKDENPDVRLAIGLPAGFVTYKNLVPRVSWLRRNLPFEVVLVAEDGEVEVI